MNQIEKDNIIDLLCTSTQENIELAITLCEGYNVNIEDIIEEYGYWGIDIKKVKDFQRPHIVYNSLLEINRFPNSIQSLSVYAYSTQQINYPSNLESLEYSYSKINELPDLNITNLYLNDSIVNLPIKVNSKIHTLHISYCVIKSIDDVLKCFPNLQFLIINNCNLKRLPDISKLDQLINFTCNNCNILNIDNDYKLPDSLTNLYLVGNKLTKFEININNLIFLSLQDNQITNLDIDLDNSQLSYLGVKDNPLPQITSTREMNIYQSTFEDFINS